MELFPPFFMLLVGIVVNCNGDSKMKSMEEKKVPPAAFWPYILHPKTPKRNSEEREDYYDAVREEDEEQSTSTISAAAKKINSEEAQQNEKEEEEAKQIQQMMALLLTNLDPVPMLTARNDGNAPTVTTAQTVPSTTTKQKVPPRTIKVDAETYDDERAGAGKDDEEPTEDDDIDDDDAGNKVVEKEMNKYKLMVLPDGPDSADVRKADAEADGVEQRPTKGTVDGQTHFLVDAETGGEGHKIVPSAVVVQQPVDGEVTIKRKGTAQFPMPPKAEIVRMGGQ